MNEEKLEILVDILRSLYEAQEARKAKEAAETTNFIADADENT